MIFTLLERLMIPGFLPREGSYLDMNTADNLLKAVRFDPDEMERARDPEGLNLRQNDRGGMDWENEFAEDFSMVLDLSMDQANLLKKLLVKLNDEEKLPRDALSLYQKIVEGDLSVQSKKLPELVSEGKQLMKEPYTEDETLEPADNPAKSIFQKQPEDE